MWDIYGPHVAKHFFDKYTDTLMYIIFKLWGFNFYFYICIFYLSLVFLRFTKIFYSASVPNISTYIYFF